jgi:malate/lactate dehydrogenase
LRSAAVEMADAILLDQERILPCTAYLQGKDGLNDLSDDERSQLVESANDVPNMVEVLHS